MMNKMWNNIFASFLFFFTVSSADLITIDRTLTKPTQGILSIINDTFHLFKNFADWNTYKTVVATVPLYAASRMAEKQIHDVFYDCTIHKNIHKIPSGLCTFTDKVAIQSIAVLNVGFFFFSNNEKLRQTSKLFLIGLPFLVWTTKLMKDWCHGEFALRPLHDRFCKDHKQKERGFPSTHAADFTFATTLFGLQFGYRAAVPLAIVGGLVMFAFIDDNRHYLSQIVAGGGLGVIFALAATKVIDKNLSRDLRLHLDVTEQGKPAIGLSWNF